MNLDTYFERIGYSGPRENSLAVLQDLHYLHPRAIAFEGLSAFLGTGVSLDPGVVFDKLVNQGRGGYCFEQNLLFALVLKDLGFEVTEHAARVLWRSPDKQAMARTHMLLKITVDDQDWIADVGFGGLTMTAALRLEPDLEQQTPHEILRITRQEQEYTIEAKTADQWRPMYVFDLVPCYPVDFGMSNFYVSEHPESLFRQNLMLGRPFEGGRHAMLNRDYSRYILGGERYQRHIASVDEFLELLAADFGVTLEKGDEMQALIARFDALD